MQDYMKNSVTNYNKVTHVKINYIDNSNNVIGFKEPDDDIYYVIFLGPKCHIQFK